MEKWIKNPGSQSKVWQGKTIAPGEYYKLTNAELPSWIDDESVFQDIAYGFMIVAKAGDGTQDVVNPLEGWNYLIGNVPAEVHNTSYAFADKITKDGKKLFRRKHGLAPVTVQPGQSTIFELTVPYAQCKINKLEIIGANNNDQIDFLILDTEQGMVQQGMGVPANMITPYLPLNQFGFDVCVSKDYYADESNYDAEIYGGMVVHMVFYNKGTEEVKVGVNITLHEMK